MTIAEEFDWRKVVGLEETNDRPQEHDDGGTTVTNGLPEPHSPTAHEKRVGEETISQEPSQTAARPPSTATDQNQDRGTAPHTTILVQELDNLEKQDIAKPSPSSDRIGSLAALPPPSPKLPEPTNVKLEPIVVAISLTLENLSAAEPLFDNTAYTVFADLKNASSATIEGLDVALQISGYDGATQPLISKSIQNLDSGMNRRVPITFHAPDIDEEASLTLEVGVAVKNQGVVVRDHKTVKLIDPEFKEFRDVRKATETVNGAKGPALEYLRRWPSGRYAKPVRDLVEPSLLREAGTSCVSEPFRVYKAAFPEGTGRQRAQMEKIEQSFNAYREATRTDTYEGYGDYVRNWPSSACMENARERITLNYWQQLPETPAVLTQIGNIYAGNGNWPKAKAHFKKAAEAGEPEAQIGLGKLLIRDGEEEEAIELFSKMTDENSDRYEPYLFLARTNRKRGRKKRALEYLSKAIEKNSSCAECYFERGKLQSPIRIQSYLSDLCKAYEILGMEKRVDVEGRLSIAEMISDNGGNKDAKSEDDIDAHAVAICRDR
ncbi:lipopolysaccharide assembly protein LapB [Pelagibius sp. Alg239-R121]|uniref:tetratricopeptide repeat protein n=1 Tax=Pelagibius sp. Alg239-R121 TaxID=2993448 RepID=UPI0024A61540|nr:tetratricopeptide repeat protein [Pelagibius sp. Alg239-R121]